MKKCKFEDEKEKCVVPEHQRSCSICKETGISEDIYMFVQTEKQSLKNWKWFRKWFQDHVDTKEIYMCEGTLEAWYMLKEMMDYLFEIDFVEPSQDTPFAYCLQIKMTQKIIDKLEKADIKLESQSNKTPLH